MKTYIQGQNPEKCMNDIVIMYHNIQGLLQHEVDLKSNKHFSNADCICLTETWCDINTSFSEIENFVGTHQIRSLSYDNKSDLHKELVQMKHGGVSVYYKIGIPHEEIRQIAKNLKCIVFKITSNDTYVAIIYIPQKYLAMPFMEALNSMLDNLEKLSNKIVVVGDFNENLLNDKRTVHNYMLSRGFKQYVKEPTTENGTLIDHVYVKGCEYVYVQIVPTYYSYHEAIQVTLR